MFSQFINKPLSYSLEELCVHASMAKLNNHFLRRQTVDIQHLKGKRLKKTDSCLNYDLSDSEGYNIEDVHS